MIIDDEKLYYNNKKHIMERINAFLMSSWVHLDVKFTAGH